VTQKEWFGMGKNSLFFWDIIDGAKIVLVDRNVNIQTGKEGGN
jgi:hypothetical protein